MSKEGVTLKQLLDLIGTNSEYERVQIVNSGCWDIFDDVSVGSPLLEFLYDSEVGSIEAIEHGVIRVDIDWPTTIKESETDRICVKAEDIILNHGVSDVYINRMYQVCQVALGEKTEEEVGWV